MYGTYFDDDAGSFTNSGTISASAVAGNASGEDSYVYADYVYGAYFDDYTGNFSNSGTISASALAGNALGTGSEAEVYDVYGAYFDDYTGTFTNSGTISASAVAGNASGEDSYVYADYVYGVYFDDDVGSFTNSGAITASAVAGDALGAGSEVEVYDVAGAYFYGAGSFNNSGTISASAVAGNADGDNSRVYADCVYGVYVDEYTGTFTNSGTISASALAGNASGTDSEVVAGAVFGAYFDDNVGSFSNSGDISASASAGDALGDGSGVFAGEMVGAYFYYDVGSFTNSGTISASALAGNASGTDSEVVAGAVFGAYFDDNVGSFSNSGDISASASAGDALGDGSGVFAGAVSGAYFDDNVGSFTNSGTISASASAGDALGAGSWVEVDDVYGAYFDDDVGSFTNSGTISASAVAGNAGGTDSYVEAYNVYGAYFDGDVLNFSNTGTISASATAGNASGENSIVEISDVYGVYFESGVNYFDNQGTIAARVQAGDNADVSFVAAVFAGGDAAINNNGNIVTQVTAGNNATVDSVAGIAVNESDETTATINNSGNIYLSIDSASVPSSVNNAAGIYIMDSTATVSNPGAVYLYTNIAGADIRTLRAESSDVTFTDRFSVVFGSPGITERPIYIDALSSLNLNNTALVARAGSGLLLATPYDVIENDEGAVNGTFGEDLVTGFVNPDITVAWQDPLERGEDAAVEFGFAPQGNVAGRSVNMAASLLSFRMNQFSNAIHNPSLFTPILAKRDEKPVMFAQVEQDTMSDASSVHRGDDYRNGMFFLPYYTKMNDSGIGADADSYGFLLGYERKLTDVLSGGVFGGFGRSEVDFTGRYDGNSEDQDALTLGLHLLYDQSIWFADLMASYNRIDHDYSGRTGANLELGETDEYNSDAVVAQALSGLKLTVGETAGVYPYLGLRWTYWDTESHTTDVAYPNWRKHYDSFDDNWFKGIVGVNADKKWKAASNATLKLYGGVGLEHALNDNEVEMAQSLQGIRATVKEDISDTSLVGNLGLQYIRGNFSASLDLTGENNSDYDAYSGFVRLGYMF